MSTGKDKTTISLELTDGQMKFLLMYVETRNITIADLTDKIMEWMEDELDAEDADKLLDEFYKDPKTITHEEAMKELGLR